MMDGFEKKKRRCSNRQSRKTALLSFVVCLFLLLGSVNAFAAYTPPSDSETLTVHCKDRNGDPLSGEIFHVFSVTAGFDGGNITTNNLGDALFENVPPDLVWVEWLSGSDGSVRERRSVTVLPDQTNREVFTDQTKPVPETKTGHLTVTVYDNTEGISYIYYLVDIKSKETVATASLTSAQNAYFRNVPIGDYLLVEFSPDAIAAVATGRAQEVIIYPGVTGYAEFPTKAEIAEEEEKGFFESVKEFFGDITASVGSIGDFLKQMLTNPFGTLIDGIIGLLNQFTGGFDIGFLGEDWTAWTEFGAMARIGNQVYKVIYPFGVLVLVLSWAFGMTTAGLTLSLDPGNKYSIVRSALQLLIGMMLLSSGPKILQLIFAIFQSIRIQISDQLGTLSLHIFVLAILKIKCCITFVKIILMQCISPLYMGAFSGGEGTRRLAMNCLKEYLILCFEGVYASVFLLLADTVWTKMLSSFSTFPGPQNLISLIGIIAVGAAMWGSGKAVRELIK